MGKLPKLEDSDYVKAWKALPKDKREKLTKKQIEHMNKYDIMTDALIINYDDNSKKEKHVPVVREPKVEHFKQKHKPKQIMVEYTDPETGELIKQLVDKVRKKKVTPLKRAILKKRSQVNMERSLIREERKAMLS